MIDEKILNDNCNCKNKDIIILQFPNGGEISFSEGKILRMNETQIFYTSSTEPGTSGSPLIIRKNILKYYIIGIHVGVNKNKKCNFGSSFKPILDDIKYKITKTNKNAKQSKSNENNDLGSLSKSLIQNLDNYELVKLTGDGEVFFWKKGNDFEISKYFILFYYDNTYCPSLLYFYKIKRFLL